MIFISYTLKINVKNINLGALALSQIIMILAIEIISRQVNSSREAEYLQNIFL